MTTRSAIEPANEIQSATLDETLKELTRLRNDHFAVKVVLKNLQSENNLLRERLSEACTEIAQWKTECLDRRQRMIKAEKESLIRVPITGVIGQ